MALLDAQLRADGPLVPGVDRRAASAVPVGVSVGITDTVDELVDVVAGYVADGYPRIKLKIEPGFDIEPVRRGPRGQPRHHAAGRREHRLLDRRHRPPRPARRVRPAADRATVRRGRPRRPRRAGPPDHDAGVPRRGDPLPRSHQDGAGAGAAHIINIKPARVGGYLDRGDDPRPSASPPASPCGAAACSRRASAAPPTSPSPRCPASPCPATSPPPSATGPATSPRRSRWSTATIEVPTGPGFGVDVDTDFVDEITTDRRELRPR